MNKDRQGRGPNSLVERVKRLLVKPKEEWPVIAAEPASIGGLFQSYVLILAAIPAVAHLFGSLIFGYSVMGMTFRPSFGAAIGAAIGQYVLSLISVVIIALVIDGLAPTFGGEKNRVQAFKVAVYASTAAWLAGAATLIPAVSFLAILGIYSLYLLYLGLPVLMKASPEKAIGYTAVVVIVAGILSIVAGAVTRPLTGLLDGGRAPVITADSVLKKGGLSVPGIGKVNIGEMEQAVARAEKMSRGIESGDIAVVPVERLVESLPAAIGRFRRTSVESNTMSVGAAGGSHAEARYEAGDQYFELSITDMPMMGPAAAMGAAMGVSNERRTETGYTRTHVVDGNFVTEEWDNSSNSGHYMTIVSERFSIKAEGRVSGMNDLTAAVATTRPANLARLVQ